MNRWLIIGNGFIAPKHFESIKHVGGEVVAVSDIDDSRMVEGIAFFANYKNALDRVDAVSICTPNDLHAEMILEAARRGLKILCEKPITFKMEEVELMRNVPNLFGVFQLRYLPEINEMRKKAKRAKKAVMKIEMKRSGSYHLTWKGDPKRTGGLLVNIGAHYFDLLGHLFGYEGFTPVLHKKEETGAAGTLIYRDIDVDWSIELTEEKPEYQRSLMIDDIKFDLVQKENLHKKVYENFVWGQGTTVKEEEKILKMIYAISMG